MKSYESFAIAIYEGVISDAIARWSNMESSLRRDLSYLRGAVENRGLPFLTITLPELSKVFLKALDTEVFPTSDIPKGVKIRNGRPELFGDLFDLVFDETCKLRSDVCIDAVAFLLQLLSCCKNLRLECHPSKTRKTLDEFFEIEERLPTSHPDTWDFDVPTWVPRFGHPLWGVGEINDVADSRLPLDLPSSGSHSLPWSNFRALCARIIRGWVGDYPEWELQPRHGPGAVSEGRIVKFDFPNWPTKLENRFPFDWYGSGSLDERSTYPSHIERPSRLIAVPKSQKGPRLICAEPTSHQWIQQSIFRWLESRIRTTPIGRSIDFRRQDLSRDRALSSSLDGLHCTVDLSSASDRISTRLVEYTFQGTNLLDAFHASRTRALSQTISSEHPRVIRLRKFSTMGSALTFPVQSIIFFLLTLWAYRLVKGTENDWSTLESEIGEITVFGDDIIAPTMAYPTIELVLHECGLKVNKSKTFTGKNFRESCGCYAFRGVDITPAYALQPYDGSPTSLTTTIETSNNLFKKGYWNTAHVVVNQLPDAEKVKLHVAKVGGGSGLSLESFSCSNDHLFKKRWDPKLHKWYVNVLGLRNKVDRTQGTGGACLSQYFFERPDPMYSWESGQTGRVRLRKCLTRVYL